MKYKIYEKAYAINMSKVYEGYMYDSERFICRAPRISVARSKLLTIASNENLTDNSTDREITFLNIPVVRAPEYDLLHFEDKHLTARQIQEIIQKRGHDEYLNGIIADDSIKHCYIKKRGQFYKPDYCGYTDYISYAGVYTKEDAVKHARGTMELRIVPINITEHNSIIQSQIISLQSRLI